MSARKIGHWIEAEFDGGNLRLTHGHDEIVVERADLPDLMRAARDAAEAAGVLPAIQLTEGRDLLRRCLPWIELAQGEVDDVEDKRMLRELMRDLDAVLSGPAPVVHDGTDPASAYHRVPWIGVDLDGTLAEHPVPWRGVEHVGEPVPAMAARVRAWLAEGKVVKVVTARVCSGQPPGDTDRARLAIRSWCARHLGTVLEVTAEKDWAMVELWDDRAVRILRDQGVVDTPFDVR